MPERVAMVRVACFLMNEMAEIITIRARLELENVEDKDKRRKEDRKSEENPEVPAEWRLRRKGRVTHACAAQNSNSRV